MNALTLVPAYGRDYTSKRQVEEAFLAGKDFLIYDVSSRWDGKPANLESLQEDGYSHARIYFRKKTTFCTLSVPERQEKKA